MGKNGQSVIVAAYTASMWSKLCTAMGMPQYIDDPELNTVSLRVKNLGKVVSIIEGWLGQFDNIDDGVAVLERGGVACCKIRSTREVVSDPVLWEHGTFIELPTQPSIKETKTIKARGPWIRFSKTPAVMRRAPDLGEHNYEVLGKYGWNKAKVDEMKLKWSSKFKKQ